MMEIIAVIFQGILELFYDILLQFVIQAVAEALFELMGLGIGCLVHKKLPPWGLLLCYSILGIICGLMSVNLFPQIFIHQLLLRWIAILVIPLIIGGLFSLIGRIREKFNQSLTKLDNFLYAYIFALSMALIRFWLIR